MGQRVAGYSPQSALFETDQGSIMKLRDRHRIIARLREFFFGDLDC